MKQLIIFLFLVLPSFCFSQNKYSIQRISYKDISGEQSYGRMPKSQKAFIIVTDSTFSYEAKEGAFTYMIIKKVNDNYFKATDGLKEYIIRIDPFKFGPFKTNIIIEYKKTITSFLSKDEIVTKK